MLGRVAMYTQAAVVTTTVPTVTAWPRPATDRGETFFSIQPSSDAPKKMATADTSAVTSKKTIFLDPPRNAPRRG
jgi:hypothetical protein